MSGPVEFEMQELDADGARDMRHKMTELLSTPAWQYISGTIKLHYNRQIAEIIATPLTSMDDTLKQEYTKGHLAAYCALWTMPESMIAFFTSIIEHPNGE
jgi:hypothetical protein